MCRNGGPTNVDNPKDLSGICDRSEADVRGIKKTISAKPDGRRGSAAAAADNAS